MLPSPFARRKTHNLKDCQTILGVAEVKGWADGDVLTVTWDADLHEYEVGATGEVQRSATNNRMAEARIRLQSTSNANAVLMALLRADQLSGHAPIPFLFRNPNTGERVAAVAAFIKKYPDMTAGQSAGSREWTLQLTAAEYSYQV